MDAMNNGNWEQMRSWVGRVGFVLYAGEEIGSEYQMIWTELLDTNGQDRSATRPPEGGSEMHSLIYFLLTQTLGLLASFID
jgi:hypothetical protein